MSVHAIASRAAGRAATGPENLRQSLDRLLKTVDAAVARLIPDLVEGPTTSNVVSLR